MILVTGASGFLGQHLVRALSQKGLEVRALYHQHPPANKLKELKGVSWVQADLLDVFDVEDVMQGINEVYHCAAIVSFHPHDKEKMLHFNVAATANIVDEARAQDVRKLVFVSSVAALGRRSDGNKLITEEEQWEESRYNSRYGLSKHLAEIEVWRAAAEGLNAVVINPAIILGEGNWEEGSARLMKVVNDEFPFYTGGINGWVDVLDVVESMIALMNSDIVQERFIVSAGNYAYKDIFSKMAEALNKKPPHIHAGRLMTALVWRWSMIKSGLSGHTATITRETASTAQNAARYDNTKLLKLLPDFRYRPVQETIARMARAFQQQTD